VPYHRSRFGDTTLTKVFVGGLAWETASAGLHDHFRDYGEILEAVVITDRDTGRSKGYGFVRPLPSLSLALALDVMRALVSSDSYVCYAGDVPGPGVGKAGGAGPQPDDRRPPRQLQHCLHGPAAPVAVAAARR
jgi:hypothetical protein